MVLSLRASMVESNNKHSMDSIATQSDDSTDFVDQLRSYETKNRRNLTAREIQKFELEHKEFVVNYFVYHQQSTTIAEYESSFLELKRWAETWGEENFDEQWVVNRFVVGLKEELRSDVERSDPRSLNQAINLAKWQEMNHAHKVFDKIIEPELGHKSQPTNKGIDDNQQIGDPIVLQIQTPLQFSAQEALGTEFSGFVQNTQEADFVIKNVHDFNCNFISINQNLRIDGVAAAGELNIDDQLHECVEQNEYDIELKPKPPDECGSPLYISKFFLVVPVENGKLLEMVAGRTDADEGLHNLPRLRFNKEGNLLTTAKNGIKILANAVCLRSLRSVEAVRAPPEPPAIKVSGSSAILNVNPVNCKVERSSPVRLVVNLNGVDFMARSMEKPMHVDVKNGTILDLSPHQLVDDISARSTKHWPDSPHGIREAYRVLQIGEKSYLIITVYPTFWLSHFFLDVWVFFPTQDEYIEWFDWWFEKVDFKNVHHKRISPKGYLGIHHDRFIILAYSVTDNATPYISYIRCSTPELASLNVRNKSATGKYYIRTELCLEALMDAIRKDVSVLTLLVEVSCLLDMIINSFAHMISTKPVDRYTRPQFTDNGLLAINAGRHPILESVHDGFIPNNIFFSEASNMVIVTGPNMSGKKYLCSTRSLVVIDELGRATSSNGLAIAWSCSKHLLSLRAYTIFATHIEKNNRLDFKFQLKDGLRHVPHNGLLLAGVAGVPGSVIDNARSITSNITAKEVKRMQVKFKRYHGREWVQFVEQVACISTLRTRWILRGW